MYHLMNINISIINWNNFKNYNFVLIFYINIKNKLTSGLNSYVDQPLELTTNQQPQMKFKNFTFRICSNKGKQRGS